MFPGFLSMCMSYKIFLVTGHFDTTKVFHAMFFINLSTSLSFLLTSTCPPPCPSSDQTSVAQRVLSDCTGKPAILHQNRTPYHPILVIPLMRSHVSWFK